MATFVEIMEFFMNTPNNKRRRESKERMEKVFIELMQTHELDEISVTEICKRADVNRTTFYANYDDVYDLANKVLHSLMSQVDDLYFEEVANGFNSNDFSKLLWNIYENQIFYKTCFKLGIGKFPIQRIQRYDMELAEKYFHGSHVDYHIEYFRAGFNRVIEMWLERGCPETPEEINDIIHAEYQAR